MMRSVCALLLVPFLVVAAYAQGDAGRVQITWHGQSFFEIKSSKGTNIVTDPHVIPEYGRVVGLKADAVTFSHAHTDHIQLDAIANKDKGLKIISGFKGQPPREDWNSVNETFKDVKIRNLPCYHDNVQGMKNGKNTIFIFELDGWKIVHLGDLGHKLSAAQVKAIGPVDVLMIPIGGVYTLNGTEAQEVVKQLKPKEYIIPMHYGTTVYTDLLGPGEFLEDQSADHVARSKDNVLVLNRDPQRPRPLIALLHYWPAGKKKAE